MKYISGIALGLIMSSVFFSSCYYDSKEELFGNAAPCDTIAVSYVDDILPILTSQCYLCHSTTTAAIVGGDNDMEGYDKLMGFVVAGEPENSLFYASVAWLTGAVQMPRPTGSSQLSDCELSVIRNWIIQGATNN